MFVYLFVCLLVSVVSLFAWLCPCVVLLCGSLFVRVSLFICLVVCLPVCLYVRLMVCERGCV